MLKGKHIILGISGGIAAYKSATLIRLLVKAGAEVQVIITPNGKEFITPVTLSALSGKPVISEFFTANTGEWHSHVDLGLWADAMIVAPATACTLAKMANGVADNMLVTTYLSAKAPVFVAPAMDLDMMSHPTTARNLETLRRDGVIVIEAASGELASHLVGKGRMEEPENIVKVLDEFFDEQIHEKQTLRGKRVLITAGPTHEPIDPVRFIGNSSTGKMGFALADEAAHRGADVTVVAGPVTATPTEKNVKVVPVTTAQEMLDACRQYVDHADIVIFSAAVADYAPAEYHDRKVKREKDQMDVIHLVKNPDIASTLAHAKHDGQIMVGFALETDHALENAHHKLKAKNLDAIVLNTLEDSGAGFGTDTNKVTVLGVDQSEKAFPLKSKADVAADIFDQLDVIEAALRKNK